jgi:hypothetical protein
MSNPSNPGYPSESIRIRCPWTEYGEHETEVPHPLIHGSVHLDPHCMQECCVDAGPPPRLRKRE